jgi:hypothetical protein
MAEVTNAFLKSKMNQDLDARILPKGEYRRALNLQISRSEGSTVGEFEQIPGTTRLVQELDSNALLEIIGTYVDNTNKVIYLFSTTFTSTNNNQRALSTDKCFIHQLDLSTSSTAPAVKLVEGHFLNFDKRFPIYGINLIETLLFWTDNKNQPRKINVANANPTGASSPTKYQYEPQISVAKYYPYQPIVAMNRSQSRTDGVVNTSDTVWGVKDTSGIQVGDIVTVKDKNNSTILITNIIYVVGVFATTIKVSAGPSSALPNQTYLDFSRPSMTNKKKEYVSNFFTGNVTSVAGGAVGDLITVAAVPGSTFKDPVIGMLVTCSTDAAKISTGAGVVPANTGVIQAVARVGGSFTIALDVTNTLIANNKLVIGNNPDYNSTWKGNPAFLEGRYVRFSYRFKFEDNEYSLMAPFSQIMFIPKQKGFFGLGQDTSDEDMESAYKSTILAWFENNIDSIDLKIPIPRQMDQSVISNRTLLNSYYLISDIDILYKESDALSVKVLDTVSLSSNINFTYTAYEDFVQGDVNQYFYDYNYESSKPYKTLPESQTVRVYDRVPIRALSQEVTGNRVTYGNFVDNHTAPDSINYNTSAQQKSIVFDNFTQFPNSSLKQNRTYQVGIVLADMYGRQSDVILSSNDNVLGSSGSTVFHPYTEADETANGQTFSWIGDALRVTFNESIGAQFRNYETGEPGWFNSSNNPLGWFSYKIVVKQQEQDYYNVYMPGFVNGYPITTDLERNISYFTPLFGDNVNKIPRDLNEVGPNQTQYTSSTKLYCRVNNPDIFYRTNGDHYNSSPYNIQYFPGNKGDTVLNIQTMIDGELCAIPFISGRSKGTYNDVIQTGSSSVFSQAGNGKIPWGTGPGESNGLGLLAAPFYNLENNPLIAQISMGALTTNPVGAVCTNEQYIVPPASVTNGVRYSFGSVLTIAETNPTESLLAIFWETSSSGYLPDFNTTISTQDPGVTSTTELSFTFPETLAAGGTIDAAWSFKDGGGTVVTPSTGVISATILSVYSNNGTVNVTNAVPFAIVQDSADYTYELKTGPSATFWYGTNSPQDNVYQITYAVTYTPTGGATYNSTVSQTVSLTNVAPPNTIANNSRFPLSKTIGTPSLDGDRLVQVNDTYILWETSLGSLTQTTSFIAENGSSVDVNSTNLRSQIIYEIHTQVDGSGAVDIFEINAIKNGAVVPGLLAVKSGKTMVLNKTYTIQVRAYDCNKVGVGFLFGTSSLSFTAGAQHVNQAVCNGLKLNNGSGGSNTFNYSCTGGGEFHFRNSLSLTPTGNLPSYSGVIWGTTFYYNVARQYNLSAGTSTSNGGLNLGAQMYIIPRIVNPVNGACSTNGEVSGYFTIQYRAASSGNWGPATTAATVTAGPANTQLGAVQIQSVIPGNTGSFTYEFDAAGEYRVLTTPLSGPRCATPACSTDAKFTVLFGDATPGYGSQCNLGPL